MIVRVWRGWTLPENAEPYETLLRTEILPGIATQDPEVFLGSEVLRRELNGEVEFMTILRFESREGIRQFVGEPITRAHIPDAARRLLHRYDERVRHYESRERTATSDR